MKVLIVLAVCFAACFADEQPKFEAPEPFKWDESFQVFVSRVTWGKGTRRYEKLDEQHRGLFEAIYNVSVDNECQDTFQKLVDVIDAHFAYEEGEMKRANYEHYDIHKKAHESFQNALHQGKAPVDAEHIRGAKEWLVNHIKGTDFHYKGKL